MLLFKVLENNLKLLNEGNFKRDEQLDIEWQEAVQLFDEEWEEWV